MMYSLIILFLFAACNEYDQEVDHKQKIRQLAAKYGIGIKQDSVVHPGVKQYHSLEEYEQHLLDLSNSFVTWDELDKLDLTKNEVRVENSVCSVGGACGNFHYFGEGTYIHVALSFKKDISGNFCNVSNISSNLTGTFIHFRYTHDVDEYWMSDDMISYQVIGTVEEDATIMGEGWTETYAVYMGGAIQSSCSPTNFGGGGNVQKLSPETRPE